MWVSVGAGILDHLTGLGLDRFQEGFHLWRALSGPPWLPGFDYHFEAVLGFLDQAHI